MPPKRQHARPGPTRIEKTLLTLLGGVGAALVVQTLLRRSRRLDLSRKNVVIMGGSRGLGLALAHEFARQGANLALCARNSAELDRAAFGLRSSGAQVRTQVCDVTSAADVRQTIATLQATHPIDVLVNCAGTMLVGPFEAMTLDDFHKVLDVNFWGALHAIFAVLPAMKRRGQGRIVNIASIGGKTAVPHLAAYCASKFALVGLSGALRAELQKYGVLVTTINPGLMRTGSPRHAFMKGNAQAEYAWFSIADSLPGISISAAAAARRIVQATRYGESEVTIGLPAILSAKFTALAPSIHLELAALVDRLLPQLAATGIPHGPVPGYKSESYLTQSFLRSLGKRAEKDYNQLSANPAFGGA